ncbi:PREDICTED: farnesyl pyrophosphate synthase-like [Dinoponera quadriceps]|uniref:Farnesyl pyrophosphate synthase n=1 Tax=Dinoponera quadriceps TaxID=609295 RepID=A0A6P3WWA0_DINQU|nr:PREDICTED: farnesyl pyrophosphate synthase-like [Dinoponera quadriceps]
MSIARNRLLLILKQAQCKNLARTMSLRYISYTNKIVERAVYTSGSDNMQKARVTTKSLQLTSQNETRELMTVWPDIVQDIVSVSQKLNLPDVTEWLTRVLEYNVPGGKNTRALMLLYAYYILTPADRITRENVYLARILAWCMELLQAFLLVLDDIEDRSLIRRKQLCWYRHEDVGLTAINDAVLIESVMYHLLRKHFKGRECYTVILETCQEIMMKTLMGQCLEFTNFGKTLNLDRFTMDRYDDIAYYKTAYYTFILPVIVAMHFVGIKSQKLFGQATAILMKIGHFYQVQDDYLSCYGNREVLGKIGTDIEEGKCTWLAVTALQRVTPEQRNILEECYGSTDSEKVKRVRKLYQDLNLPRLYLAYERETYGQLNAHIQQMSRDLPQELFRMILNDIYRRTK